MLLTSTLRVKLFHNLQVKRKNDDYKVKEIERLLMRRSMKTRQFVEREKKNKTIIIKYYIYFTNTLKNIIIILIKINKQHCTLLVDMGRYYYFLEFFFWWVCKGVFGIIYLFFLGEIGFGWVRVHRDL
ncbi:hypothetical protein MANES_03G095816v8 [Manihot esculenta]|uniref:Uncharacterized protein n=1 Tax=Manihot esculenta TaxID=3983 RepID=A0ACB7HZN1_MANES|nr:hypothetical protein MANES_03G095816v8 [Manihot esculenta]